MESNLSEEELDRFLKEAGIVIGEQEYARSLEKEDRLEKLVDEIMGSTHTASPVFQAESTLVSSPLIATPLKPRRSHFPLLPLFVSMAFLGGILLGTGFGFYWGKTQR